jgi:Ca2+-binding EF-hand superfamily protein
MKSSIKAAAILLALGSASVIAADAAEIESRFKAADKDGDGKLTLEEAKAGMPRVARGFDKIDTDKKGYITLDEIKAKAPR